MKLTEKQAKILAQASKIMEEAAIYNRQPMINCDLVGQYLSGKIGFKENEHFVVLYLDNQNSLIESRIESVGTIDQASVYPRNIAKTALELNALSVILSHNHPSGICRPSKSDQIITSKIQQALALFDIRVLDHIIVAGANKLSFLEQGIL